MLQSKLMEKIKAVAVSRIKHLSGIERRSTKVPAARVDSRN